MTILFDGRFSRGAKFSNYYKIDLDPEGNDTPPLFAGRPGRYEYVTDPRDRLTVVAKLTKPADAPSRSELRPFQTDFAGANPDWGTRWYYWSFCIPSYWKIQNSISTDTDSVLCSNARTLITQIHETEDVGDAAHFPCFQQAVDGEKLKIILTNDTNANTVSRVPNLRVLDGWPVRRDVWEHCVLKMHYASNNNGLMEYYQNDRLQFSYSGSPTGYNDSLSPYIKGGLYGYSGTNQTDPMVILFDGYVIGDENSSYEEVTGRVLRNRSVVRG